MSDEGDRDYTKRVIRPKFKEILALIEAVSREEILPKFGNLAVNEISMKSSNFDLVTSADHASENRLTRGLRSLFPEAHILGEESIAADPSLRKNISHHELCFIIDPIDGTWNFSNGIGFFGVILSATHYGRPLMGVLYDPLRKDAQVVLADDGHAYWQSLITQGPKLTVSKASEIKGFVPVQLFHKTQREAVARAASRFAWSTSFYCSCQEYRLLAQGSFEFSLACLLNPWDHIAGCMIVEASGGYVRMLDGRPYTVDTMDGYLLAASSREVFEQVKTEFSFLCEDM